MPQGHYTGIPENSTWDASVNSALTNIVTLKRGHLIVSLSLTRTQTHTPRTLTYIHTHILPDSHISSSRDILGPEWRATLDFHITTYSY